MSAQSMHPCLTPEFTGKKSEMPLPHFTELSVPEYKPVMRPIILAGIPNDMQNIPECPTMN